MLSQAVTAAFMLLSMALAIIVGVYVFIYAAYRFLVIVQETAAGVDEVRYPSDPFMDKLPRAAYLAGLLAICIVPAGFFLKLSPDFALGGSPVLTFFVAAATILWALFPVGLLSALSASSPWMVFRLTVLWFFLRRIRETVVFYAVSALLAAGSFGLIALAIDRGSWLLTLAAPFVVAAAFLIYARLLGRMAYLFDQLPALKRRRNRAPGPRASDPWAGPKESRKKQERTRRTETAPGEDPWAVPEDKLRQRKKGKAVRVEGYAIADNETNPGAVEQPSAKRPELAKTYGLADEPLPSLPRELPLDGYVPVGYEPVSTQKESEGGPGPTPAADMGSDFASRYGQRLEESPPPARPLVSGVYTFPWYPGNLPAWLVLALAGGAIGCLIQVCVGLKNQLGS